MFLQDRDYTIFMNDEERKAFEEEQKCERRKGPKNSRIFPRFSHTNAEIRKFVWHRRSMFPNNYLHFTEYKELDFVKESESYMDIT